jgi:deazaflavin-dependent oxidoreductase (nitroreductase family)
VNSILRGLLRAPAYLYRLRCGWLFGHRFLLLIQVGRRTGFAHHTVLEILEYRPEGPEVVVMSAFGPKADWLRNIEARPIAEVVVGTRRFTADFRVLGPEEAAQVIAGYERRNRIVALVIRLVLSRLLGWRYHGSDSDRRRLVAQLPLIAFRPAAATGLPANRTAPGKMETSQPMPQRHENYRRALSLEEIWSCCPAVPS